MHESRGIGDLLPSSGIVESNQLRVAQWSVGHGGPVVRRVVCYIIKNGLELEMSLFYIGGNRRIRCRTIGVSALSGTPHTRISLALGDARDWTVLL